MSSWHNKLLAIRVKYSVTILPAALLFPIWFLCCILFLTRFPHCLTSVYTSLTEDLYQSNKVTTKWQFLLNLTCILTSLVNFSTVRGGYSWSCTSGKTYKLSTSLVTFHCFQVFPAQGAIVEISKPPRRTILNWLLNSRIRSWLVMSVQCFE